VRATGLTKTKRQIAFAVIGLSKLGELFDCFDDCHVLSSNLFIMHVVEQEELSNHGAETRKTNIDVN
jgi:hypothetical protein